MYLYVLYSIVINSYGLLRYSCILGIWTVDPVWSLLLMLRPWMGHGYTVIQVINCLELLEQRRLCPSFFVKIWTLINGTQQCGIGLPEIHRNSTG